MKRPRLLLLCLALTAALLALAVALRPWYAQVVAEHWRAQLKTVPDQRAEILLRKVAALGEPGIPVLVEALGSQRESVAGAANRLLTQRLDSWQRSSEEEDERHQAILVEALAEQVGGFGPTAQRNAARLATRVLQWLPDPKVVDRSHVIACCERVFRATEASGGLPSDEQLATWSLPQEEQVAGGGDRLPRTDPGEAAASIARLGPLPGGGLPIPLLSEPPRQPEASEPFRLADADAERPRRLSALPIARLLNPLCQPDALSHAPEEVVRGPSLTVPTDGDAGGDASATGGGRRDGGRRAGRIGPPRLPHRPLRFGPALVRPGSPGPPPIGGRVAENTARGSGALVAGALPRPGSRGATGRGHGGGEPRQTGLA